MGSGSKKEEKQEEKQDILTGVNIFSHHRINRFFFISISDNQCYYYFFSKINGKSKSANLFPFIFNLNIAAAFTVKGTLGG